MIEGFKCFQTVGENRMGFRECRYKRALVTRKLYHMVGAPTFRNLKIMISQNIIQNLPVTVEDFDISENIFGPDVVRYSYSGSPT